MPAGLADVTCLTAALPIKLMRVSLPVVPVAMPLDVAALTRNRD